MIQRMLIEAGVPSRPMASTKPWANSTWLPVSTHVVPVSPAMQNPAPHAASA